MSAARVGWGRAPAAEVSAGWDLAPVKMEPPEVKPGLVATLTPSELAPKPAWPPLTPTTESLGFAPPPTHFPTRRQE